MNLKHRIHESLKSKRIYNFLPLSTLANYFNYTEQKFLSNVDTFYYSIKIGGDWNEDVESLEFVKYLDVCRQAVMFEPFILELEGLEYQMKGMGFSLYKFDLHSEDRYSIFISNKIPNKDTPEIFVQIRSAWLWLKGEDYCIRESLFEIKKLLSGFDIKVSSVKENRIDFAYHTNYIQDMKSFFDESKLGKMQVSHFKRWHKEGSFDLNDESLCDYFTLGRRKSNNVFLRVYNKTQEVIQLNYKQFFIHHWLDNGLISFYDSWCYEKCFERGSYNYMDKARLEFYLTFVCNFGLDIDFKSYIISVLESSDNIEIRKLADELLPKVLLVCNIEFQTKSKFWNSFNSCIDTIPSVSSCDLDRIFKIIYNKSLFLDFLTSKIIRFVDLKSSIRKKDKPNANWWDLLRKSNSKKPLCNVELYRTYQKEVSKEVVKRNILSALASFSLYIEKEKFSFVDDLDDFLEYMNENDLEKYSQMAQKKAPIIKARMDRTFCKK